MTVLKYLCPLVIAYLAGAIPFGLLIGFYNGVDIRKFGSGNIGATNVTRCCGPLLGKVCFGCDFLKGFLPTWITLLFFPDCPLVVLGAAACTVLGHMFPCYLKFKGGKGVSTAGGAMLAVAPVAVLTAGILWVIFFLWTRYVSVASIIAALAIIAVVWAGRLGDLCYFSATAKSLPTVIFCTVLGLLAIARHKENIVRLIHGTENRFERKK